MKATEAVKSTLTKTKHKKYGSCPKSKLCSIRYDQRSYTLNFKTKQVSILTINGRLKVKLNIPHYYNNLLSWEYGSADLYIIKNKVYLHITFTKDIPQSTPTNKLLGIDRGINNIAVTSDNKFYRRWSNKESSK